MTQKPAVLGYTVQNPENIKLANHFKLFEEELLRVLDDMQERPSFDGRWAAIARTHFQEGFMAMNRAVFQPQRVEGHVDMEQVVLGIFELMEARPKRDHGPVTTVVPLDLKEGTLNSVSLATAQLSDLQVADLKLRMGK